MNHTNKTKFGQFFTITNPFDNVAFFKWLEEHNLNNRDELKILEPFAGTNNIPLLMREIKMYNDWDCYDIKPQIDSCNNVINRLDEYKINVRDTIKNYPQGYDLVITNPPYLARNSASKQKIEFINTKYDNLYKECLKLMLKNNKYVAAIIPETFITSTETELKNRLHSVVSLTMKMFDDTDCPVCLALFSDKTTKDFKIYKNDNFIGHFKELKSFLELPQQKYYFKFNDNNGEIWLKAIDDTNKDNIYFSLPNENSKKVYEKSRSYSRIKLPENITINKKYLNKYIDELNKYLFEYRKKTNDVFMSSFKGLRKDYKYRRRLSWEEAKRIMGIVYEKFFK